MAIHATLLHNPGAGFDQYSKEELLKALQKKGIEVTYIKIKENKFPPIALQKSTDLIIIAGGDGTVIKTARNLANKNIPIGLLPIGTANNIATCLGISGSPLEIIAAWDISNRKPFSLGLSKGPLGDIFFLESVGFGLFPRLIRQRMGSKGDKQTREEELNDALLHQHQIVREYNPHFCTITLDGKRFSHHYIMIEIMNTNLAGPNLDLAPNANLDDQFLDVVMVREDERELFENFLSNRMKGISNVNSQLHVEQVKEIQIEWHGIHYHLDDEAYENNYAPIKMDIQVIPKGLFFLAV